MVMTPDLAQSFAREWVKAWNDHDLEAILSHYAEDVTFHSPRIRQVTGRDVDALSGKAALRDYWGKALGLARDLYFEIDQVLAGSDALTVLPYSVVFLSRRTVPLETLPLKIDHPDRQLGVLTMAERQGPPAVRQFNAFLQAECERLQARMDHEQQVTRRRG